MSEEEKNKQTGISGWLIFLIIVLVLVGLYVLLRVFNVLLVHHVKKKYMPANIKL